MWGPLDNPRKRELINGVPFNPKRAGINAGQPKDIWRTGWLIPHDIYPAVKTRCHPWFQAMTKVL